MIIVGTSGFFYRSWKGVFYPSDVSPSKWLGIYAAKLNGLEINSTFYRLPVRSSIRGYKKFADRLTFVFKLYRGITHYRELKDEYVSAFLKIKEILGDSLYCLLAQFPASFRPSERAMDFILSVKEAFSEVGVVFELRAPQWEVHREWLKENGFVVCRIDSPPYRKWWQGGIFSQKTAYFRFHGRRRLYSDSYTDEELESFADEISTVNSEDVLCFFNNTTKGMGALNAVKLRELLEKRCKSE
ncbi:Uncharacterized conserved protein YecE, DUF72 family [Desulfurobacterium pacificum]|uniref:Uncharacterized conserved protein YecE, DUF72 family n=1 Tax=Desulfurobacterium pacificum TaxID=240166 RepID=A0ABY1NES8_9BACT|nr:DUF72 domain-containing protein [Desulfurobacterium pacificum]SMP07128.1 Uncharacterized conserved protein YecE, DUF72 family [Desulfurobacterium pacificum]